jgi:para-aminobenzoate N-oxygenase AurF
MNSDDSRLATLSAQLTAASEARQMSITSSHPWDEPVTSDTWLRARDKLSIYGTPYFDLATPQEIQRLSVLELGTWWNGFIVFERLVTEYYMRLINQGTFRELPEVERYMHHFCREEINHVLVFEKGLRRFGVDWFPVPESMTDFYVDNSASGKYPLMNVYLTLVIEWIADLYQRTDVDGDEVCQFAKTVVREHTREEARHIAWAQQMIVSLAGEVPGFLDQAQQFTPMFVRQFLDSGITNVDCFERVEFKDPAFRDVESLLVTLIDSPHRKRIHQKMMKPVFKFFCSSGIYQRDYHDLWVDAGFAEDLADAGA